jgi:hypothetical protein
MISNCIRNFIALILWLALALVCLYVNVQVTIANYLGCKSALELQGYEGQPLYTDSLVGQFLGSFFGDATLAQFFALGVSIVEALSLFFLFHIGFGLFNLFEIRKENKLAKSDEQVLTSSNEHQSAAEMRAATHRIILSFVKIAFIVGFLYWAVRWDLDLFRFRSIAGALANGAPDVNPLQVPSWANFVTTNDHLFIKGLVDVGAWGYLAITALGCFLLEESFENLTERWARLMAPADRMVEGWFAPALDSNDLFYGYDVDGQPVYDQDTPIAYDTEGNPLSGNEVTQGGESAVDDEETVVNPRNVSVETNPTAQVNFNEADARPVTPIVNSSGNGNGHSSAPLFDSPQANQSSAPEEWPNVIYEKQAAAQEGLQEVIGADSERIDLTAAQAKPGRYYVDQATGQIWDRSYWESIHGVTTEASKTESL